MSPCAVLDEWVAACGSAHVAYTMIGIHKSTWSLYYRGQRVLPLYVKRSIESHLLLKSCCPKRFADLLDDRKKDVEFDMSGGKA
jgi:hypothetical protein